MYLSDFDFIFICSGTTALHGKGVFTHACKESLRMHTRSLYACMQGVFTHVCKESLQNKQQILNS
jgi:hypothetical protein